nr:replication protein A 70 kDa DNA-binding subunit [Tanacetum cinerariifolium]
MCLCIRLRTNAKCLVQSVRSKPKASNLEIIVICEQVRFRGCLVAVFSMTEIRGKGLFNAEKGILAKLTHNASIRLSSLLFISVCFAESVSSYSVGTSHSVPNQATSSKNVRSSGVHNVGVTSWYIDIGDCDCSYEHCGARFWFRERLKGYSKDRKVEYHNCNFVDLSLKTVIARW